MARGTRGPNKTDNLRRVSVNPPRWRRGRWLLVTEAVVVTMIGLAGLLGVVFGAPTGAGFSLVGIPLTATLSWVMVGHGAAAALSATHRRLALLFCAVTATVTLGFVIVAAVAGVHQSPGPMGFTPATILWWAVLFCYNFALGFWLIPDRIEGPAWIPRRRTAGRPSRPEGKPG
ncbi:divalent metal cation transporter [Mycobacterium stomatepiae]|uniref:Uncharacterized protein n=1 Tax=Mycobacterium stomatepiae TaxID=470076 RepID=A0A7I7Q6A8_9MYCO|nr:divalent metal cation transporter [Mycobacterium stomatepiae]MCV7163505.1 hypothetical protein [Mycobacterium stomatepiae]BBY21546.1 hypothetical protein MSTO_17510 [Mycobacterium stomatepiae]